ncbi:MAG: glycosyltransferase family 2 protein [Candidatus Latescibacteria bacterium]|nr:glycosyltransferase family 2 protein [Candidatus Latescibacterota bacterium]
MNAESAVLIPRLARLPGVAVPTVSIIVPVYKSSATLVELDARLNRVLDKYGVTFETIFVNDACPSGSIDVLNKIVLQNNDSIAISLQRNVGQQRAVLTGLSFALGKTVVVMDADLQDPPEAIPKLLDALKPPYQAAFTTRRGSFESPGRMLTSRIFKWLVHVLTGIPKNVGMFVALKRPMVDALLELETATPYMLGMIGFTNRPTTAVTVTRPVRASGQSAYTPWKRLRAGATAFLVVLGYRLRRRKSVRTSWRNTVQIASCIQNVSEPDQSHSVIDNGPVPKLNRTPTLDPICKADIRRSAAPLSL